MWFTTLLVGCFYDPYPSSFDWKIDRTIVAAISVWPVEGDWRIPRTVDALVLSPYDIEVVRAEICGLSDEEPVRIFGAECFSQPDLLDRIPGEVPLVWTPDELGFECTGPVIGGYTYSYGTITYTEADSGLVVDTGPEAPTCGSQFPLRIYAKTAEDEASGLTDVIMYTDPYDPRGDNVPDPASAHPLLEVIEGNPAAGNEVLLRFSAESVWYGRYAWYADDGVFLGTGRTQAAGMTEDQSRIYAQNRLQIPDDYHGPLRVAAIVQSSPPLWNVLTLEIP